MSANEPKIVWQITTVIILNFAFRVTYIETKIAWQTTTVAKILELCILALSVNM